MLAAAAERDLPLLGICRGMQALNVSRGGTLNQHLPDITAVEHRQAHAPFEPAHDATIVRGSRLHQLARTTELAVNSYHHQAIAQIGTGLTACATAPDGTIEAVSDPAAQFCLGVQWHPETLTHRPEHVLRALVRTSARRLREARLGSQCSFPREATAGVAQGRCITGPLDRLWLVGHSTKEAAMSDLGQDIGTSFISHVWSFFKQENEVRKVKAMAPAELATWRREELQRIHQQAVEAANIHSEKELRKMETTRADSIRVYEVVLRNRRGMLLSQYLLEGMDVRGLDMSKFRKGALNQQHIERAIGDSDHEAPARAS